MTTGAWAWISRAARTTSQVPKWRFRSVTSARRAATWERTHYISTQRYSRSNTSAPTLTGLAAIQHVHIPAHICFILFSWLYTCVYMYRLILFRSFFFFFTMTSVMSNCTDLNLDFSRVNTAIYFPVLNFWKCHKRVYVRILWKTDLAYLGRGQGVFLSHDDWLWAQPLLCGSISVYSAQPSSERHLRPLCFISHHFEHKNPEEVQPWEIFCYVGGLQKQTYEQLKVVLVNI